MRYLTPLALGVLLALGAAGSSASVTANPGIDRCNAGLNRSIAVCNNIHDAFTTNWQKCIDYSVSMHRLCVLDAVDHMDTVGG